MDKGKHRSSTRGFPITVRICTHVWLTHLQKFGSSEWVWIWPGSWDNSTDESLLLWRGSSRRTWKSTWLHLCERVFLWDSQFSWCVFVVPSWSGSTWWGSAAQRNVSKWWILSSIACTTKRQTDVLLERGGGEEATCGFWNVNDESFALRTQPIGYPGSYTCSPC